MIELVQVFIFCEIVVEPQHITVKAGYEKFLITYPMYQYITFARICIIDGVSPEPMAYLWCILSSVVVLGLGILTFKRHQDKFVLYL